MAEEVCGAHRFHSPRPQYLDEHHIHPLSWGGPDTKDNVVPLCQTGHANVHDLLREYQKLGETPPWETRRQHGPGERALAAEAWRRERAGLDGN